jgi:hypothetical protein
MALLVGIDEAGYGPHLGPLVVAAAALEFPATEAPPTGRMAGDALPDPDLWGALRTHVRKRRGGPESRLLICDSKIAYSGGNLAPLERAVLGALAAMGRRPPSFAELLDAIALAPADRSDDLPSDGDHGPWAAPQTLALPVAAAASEIEAAADGLAKGLAGIGGRVGGLWVSVASAARLNRLMDGGRNKAGALFALAADLLGEVLRRCPSEPIHITMDRHGGRRYYGSLLAGAFPMTPVETLQESPETSGYRLLRGADAAPATLTIRDRCETWSLPTALASMAAKYVRELAMRQLNAYFQSLVPDLKATAGYGTDAWRFLRQVAAAREAAGVPDEVILRRR